MNMFLHLFDDLGYKKVVAIFDGDKENEMKDSQEKFPNYKHVCLCADDIRDKEERITKQKQGLTDTKGNLKDKYRDYIDNLIGQINAYLQ